jgi:hypothetical protein
VTVEESSGVTIATVQVPEGTLSNPEAIERAVDIAFEAGEDEEATLEINVEDVSDASVVKVELPVSDLGAIAESDVENVKIVTPVGEITLNTSAIKDLITEAASQGAAVVEIDVERKEAVAEDSSLNDAQKAALGDTEKVREVYDVSVRINNVKKDYTATNGGKLTIGLPYQLKPGEIADGVWAVHVPDSGVTEKMRDGREYKNGKAFFQTSHLSIYAVTYDLEVEEEDVTPGDGNEQPIDSNPADGVEVDVSSGSGGCNTGLPEAAMITILAAAFMTARKSRKD